MNGFNLQGKTKQPSTSYEVIRTAWIEVESDLAARGLARLRA
jgi:hypothetical protein